MARKLLEGLLEDDLVRVSQAERTFGSDTVRFLAEASSAIDLIEQAAPPFDNYDGYKSSFTSLSEPLRAQWPELDEQLKKDNLFYDSLATIFRENDRAMAFLTTEPLGAYPVIRLFNLLADKYSSQPTKNNWIQASEEGVVIRLRNEMVEILSQNIEGINIGAKPENGRLYASSYGDDYWLALKLTDSLRFNIQLTAFGNEFLQCRYHFQSKGKQPFDFIFSGIPNAFVSFEYCGVKLQESTSLSNLIILCTFFLDCSKKLASQG